MCGNVFSSHRARLVALGQIPSCVFVWASQFNRCRARSVFVCVRSVKFFRAVRVLVIAISFRSFCWQIFNSLVKRRKSNDVFLSYRKLASAQHVLVRDESGKSGWLKRSSFPVLRLTSMGVPGPLPRHRTDKRGHKGALQRG